MVVDGELSARGGNSGISSNYSDYCGDGGGGGVIDVTGLDVLFSKSSAVHYSGGRGLENGSMGQFRSTSMYFSMHFCHRFDVLLFKESGGWYSNSLALLTEFHEIFSTCLFSFQLDGIIPSRCKHIL